MIHSLILIIILMMAIRNDFGQIYDLNVANGSVAIVSAVSVISDPTLLTHPVPLFFSLLMPCLAFEVIKYQDVI